MGVEWMRLRSRRAFWALTLLALLGIALSLGSLARNAQPPSAGELASVEAMIEREMSQPYVQEQLDECRQSQAAGDDAMYGPGFDCNELLPQAEWYLSQDVVDFVPRVDGVLLQTVTPLGLAAMLLGATFAGADWSAGTIGTQLLFESRRGRQFAAKTLVVGGVMAAIAAAAVTLALLSLFGIASQWGSAEGASQAGGDVALAGLRVAATVAVAGALGVALGLALRRSIAVLGLVLAYLFVGEGLLRGVSSDAELWLGSTRITAWLQGGLDLFRYPESCSFGPCEEPIATHLGAAPSGAYLAAVALVLTAVSYAVFQRRDVG